MINSAIIEKRNKNCQRININHLIALCEIGDNYKLFCDDLESLIKSKRDKDLVRKVYAAINGRAFFGLKYKTFIEKHEHTIEIMRKYGCLSDLTILSYNAKGERKIGLSEDYFYQYIEEHKEHINTIKNVALKIKELGFNEIILDEQLDFTKMEFYLDSLYARELAFLENMEVIPTYLNNPIKYKTNGSCYCMYLKLDGYNNNRKISNYSRNIELNSLIFDPKLLPTEITLTSTIQVIEELALKKKLECRDIQASVDLSVSISDLQNEFKLLKRKLEGINKIKDNQELANLLKQMQDILAKLQAFGTNFENQVIGCHESITDEVMIREKKKYLNRRYWSSIDID